MSEYFSICNHSHINRISFNLFLWKITKSTYCICICILNYEFSLLGNSFNKFVVKLTGMRYFNWKVAFFLFTVTGGMDNYVKVVKGVIRDIEQ